MRKKTIFFSVVGLCILVVVGYLVTTSYRENVALTQLQAAESSMRGGDNVRASEQLEVIVLHYGETKASLKAADHLQTLQDRIELAEARKAVESLQRVMDGYQAMFGIYPASVADLDSGEYFFDSGYLAETLPDNYEVYLALLGQDGYQGFAIKQDGDFGFLLSSGSEKVVRQERTELLAMIERGYVEAERQRQLVFLSQR